ncbi:hypothetical protein TTHERM_01094830 (macronuclear) [Tetrahymena thermophila SB210]|uniref:Uncharacterized protein n=1 Tax=Tetrahymena thermophila (strain SB210) TaxID=312017 RepID=Q22ZH7_TETTS|nr:hypothetical protein TTHERM_01094830 [Tetrahymena thermophila SB210]EAR90670.2 hypothetical protein TTHERM_01094830 [Tetrahymena thermophila SB210]|eukprot:XP_001010915.2 hypothetical protein TTHERM_01094830 [Tetrahymena thermophila SB210]
MSFKDLSPVKGKFYPQSFNAGLFSANTFIEQVESNDNSRQVQKQNQINSINISQLPQIDSSRQKKLAQKQTIPSSILEELYQKRQHVNPNKQLVERRRNSIEKVNYTTHYYSTKSFMHQTPAQKQSSLNTINQSPQVNANKNLQHSILIGQNNNNNTFNNLHNSQIGFQSNIRNENDHMSNSLLDYNKRGFSQKPSNISQISEAEFKNNSDGKSFTNVSQMINNQKAPILQRNTDDIIGLKKVEFKDSISEKLFKKDKQINIETDLQKIRSNIQLSNEGKHNSSARELKVSISVNHTPLSNNINKVVIMSNKNNIQSASRDQNKDNGLLKQQRSFKRNFTDFLDQSSEFVKSPLQVRGNSEFRSPSIISPVNVTKNEQLSKRNSYITQCIKDDIKKEILSKSELRDILNHIQKDFSYIKNSQNGMKKGGERKDVIELSQLFDQMTLQLLEKENFTLESFFEEFEIIYNGCLGEISRQVSNDCFERGQLLEKLWKIILFITKDFIKKATQKYKATELLNLQEYGRIHQSYQSQIQSYQKASQDQQIVIEQKDVLIRKLYQQKESIKKKYKKYELMHAVLYEDFEFLERYLDKFNFQTLQMKQRISALEAQERLYIKDSDPKLKIKEEINKIAQNLSDQFILQLEDQKNTLIELYEIRKSAREKLQVVEKNLDFEFKNGKLEKKGHLDIHVADAEDIQLDDNYGQIQMNDQETSTEDLITMVETCTDSSDLFKKESKSTNTWIQTSETEVQATSTTKEISTQADIKKIIGENGKQSGKKVSESIQDIMSEFDEIKLPIDQLKNKNYKLNQLLEFEFQKWTSQNKDIVLAFQSKDEYTPNDYQYLLNYLEQNAVKSKQFITESMNALQHEQQASLQYKIETFETRLDNQIVQEKMNFQTQTLKKIIPKYNELKKENNTLSQFQVQTLLQTSQNQNKNLSGRRVSHTPYQQFGKQSSSITYLEPYTDSPDRKPSKKQIESMTSLNVGFVRNTKRHSTLKQNEQSSPLKQSGSMLFKQKSQTNISSSSIQSQNATNKKIEVVNQQAINKMKNAIQKINEEYQINQNHQNEIVSIASITDQVIAQKSVPSQIISDNEQNNMLDKSNNEDLNGSINQDGFYQNDKYTKQINSLENKQNKSSSLHQSVQSNSEERTQIEKPIDISIDANLAAASKNSSLNEFQIDEQLNSIDNTKNNQIKLFLIPPNNLNSNLPNIQEQPEPDEAITTPINKLNPNTQSKKQLFTSESSKKLVDQQEDKSKTVIQDQNTLQNMEEDEKLNQNQQANNKQKQKLPNQNSLQYKKQLTISNQQNNEANIGSDLSSDSDDGRDKPYVTNKEQIQDQMYDKKYLDEASVEEVLREHAENDEFEIALKNLDSSVNTVQPNPNIHSRMRIHVSNSKFTDMATEYLIKSFKEIKKKKNSNLFFKLTQILKIIFTILSDINKGNPFTPHSPTNKYSNPNPTKYHLINHFHIHLFENLMTSYGTGQMMFKKFFRIINGIFKYKKHPRINLVSKFLTGEYDLSDFQLFVKLCIYLYPELQTSEDKILISQSKCNEALNHFLYQNLNQKQIENIEKYVNKIKIKGAQKNQFVFDLDQILELIMENFINEVKTIKNEEYKDLYYSQDTDKKDYFNFESFKIVLENIQGQNSVAVSNLFYKESDKILDGENLLSLNRFSTLCRQNKILSQNIQSKYLSQPSNDFISELQKIWQDEQYNIKLRLIKVKKYDIKRRKMLNEIDIFLNDSNKSRHSARTIHFIFKLLQQESKELLVEEQLKQLIPQQFLIISNKYLNTIKTRFNQNQIE